jgi:hypothetical protein
MAVGLDIGTSFIVSAREAENGVAYKDFRDAFFRIKPATAIAGKMIEKGLAGTKFFKDIDGSYVVIGQEAIEKAVERHASASRPLVRGVISPKERDARRVLKFIVGELVGKPTVENEKLIYSIPAPPVDQAIEDFDVGYHCDAMGHDLKELGFAAQPLSEAEAICYSELEKDDYTGVAMSWGAGMVNICVMSNGEAVLAFSTTKSGDWIDRMAAVSSAEPDSVVQVEKEHGEFAVGVENSNRILSAVSSYYVRLIEYTMQTFAFKLSQTTALPRFADPIPIVISGGTSLAKGFIDAVKNQLTLVSLPFTVKEVRPASDQLFSVARGCLIAAGM